MAHLQDSTTSLPWINRRLTSTIYTPHHSFPFHTSRPNPWGSPEDAGSADRHPQPTLSRVDAQGAMASKPEIPWTVVAEWKYARVRKQLANGSASDESDDLEKEHGLTGIKGSVSYRQPYVLYVDDEVTTIEVPWLSKGTRRQRKKLAAARKCLVETKHGADRKSVV